MISPKELNSLRRSLRSFANNANREANELQHHKPTTPIEEQNKAHNLRLLAALTNSAEQWLEIVDYVLGTKESTNVRRWRDLTGLANEMYARHGSFMYWVIDPAKPYAEQDKSWAEDRLTAYDIIKHLVGQPTSTTTVETILRQGTFAAVPAEPQRDTDALTAAVERSLGLKPGSLNLVNIDGKQAVFSHMPPATRLNGRDVKLPLVGRQLRSAATPDRRGAIENLVDLFKSNRKAQDVGASLGSDAPFTISTEGYLDDCNDFLDRAGIDPDLATDEQIAAAVDKVIGEVEGLDEAIASGRSIVFED